ncbi:dopamine receptor 2-like [Tetranychus urticae]|uniref:G-protein coupled receptors family 1 profile domain-containing protein n=1 Tax=Tetranychus urticae TaxID=32264 RepID=T1JSJ2_TETUR|nr:dopamine receptor 2-like [Tetranychus urticae]
MSKPLIQPMTLKVSTSTLDTSIEPNINLSAQQQHQNDRSRSIGPIDFKNWVDLEDNLNLSLNDSDETFDSFGLTIEPDLRIHHPFLALFLGIICLLIIFGNILIMVAIRRERYLHTVTNLFVASLAVADCLVGAIVMPSSVVHEVMNKWWIFGQDWCDLWHSFDVLASTASILNLCVISLDRYWAITDPISYPARMTARKAKILIALVWACSAIISFPAIIWWRAVSAPPRPLRCDFTEDIGYLLFSSIISFYGPLIIMLVVYFRIYRAAINQTKSVKSGTKSIAASDGNENNAVVLRIHRGGGGGNRYSDSNSVLVNCVCQNESHQSHYRNGHLKSRQTGEVSFDDSSEMTDDSSLNVKVSAGPHRNVKTFSLSRKLAKLAKEKKAAKTLGIVMGVFILCWLPFFITNLVKGFCGDVCLINPDLVYPLVTWLGWLNSGMNPFIYACWSRDFRRAFRKILCLCYEPESYKTKISQKSSGIIPSNANDDNTNIKRVNNDTNNNGENRVDCSLSIIKIIRSRKLKLTE